ncbi:MAG: ThuA domain-containing protein [Pirellulaceae bacterium]
MNRIVLPIGILVGSALAVIAAPAKAQVPPHQAQQIRKAANEIRPSVAPGKRRTVLIWNTPPHLMDKDPHKGYCIPFGEEAIKAIGEASGAFEPVVSDDLAMYAPENLQRFDAIVLNNASGAWITPTAADLAKEPLKKLGGDATQVEAALRKSFLDFVENGGGIVCLHFAIAANRHWPEFQGLFGATFTGHPWTEEVGVTVEEPEHPLVAAFGGKDFRITDEIYEYGPPYDRTHVRVLMSIDPARTNMGARWIHRKDNDFALTWVKAYGKGRIFNTSFGHMANLYSNPQVLQFYLDAIQFAAGDLEAPTSPRASRPTPANVPGTQPAPGLEPGFVSLFDGKTLEGWDGDRTIWTVEQGAITGRTTADTQLKENNFLVWKDQVENFELRLKFRLEEGNSGIYYHAGKRPPGQTQGDPLVGTQADLDASGRWTGVIMEYLLRDVLAERGQQVTIDENGQKQVTGSLGDPAELLKVVRSQEWNDYAISAQDGRVELKINGVTMCTLNDRDPKRLVHGWLALQVHVGPPMVVQFKDVYLRRF